MSKRLTDREKLLFKLDRLTEIEVEEVLEYVSIIETNRRASAPAPSIELPEVNESPDDDLLANLSSQRENRRARQVFEWESTRRGADSGTSGFSPGR